MCYRGGDGSVMHVGGCCILKGRPSFVAELGYGSFQLTLASCLVLGKVANPNWPCCTMIRPWGLHQRAAMVTYDLLFEA